MVHVNYFLGCVKLENGGIIIAWLHIIFYVISLFLMIARLAMSSAGDYDTKWTNSPSTHFSTSAVIILVIVGLIFASIFIGIIAIAYRSIKAIKTRSHILIFEMMAMMFVLACLSLYTLTIQFWLVPTQTIPALIASLIYIYFFIVIYSLYRAFRKEYEHKLLEQEKANA